jgi:uncharacterized protein (DUF697 family)
VATSTVYLIRSMGNIYGVTFTSAIVQNLLLARLPDVLGTAANDEVRGFAPISELMSFHRR